jgi:hypothetical protein
MMHVEAISDLAIDVDLTLATQTKSSQTRRVYCKAVRQRGDFLTTPWDPTRSPDA